MGIKLSIAFLMISFISVTAFAQEIELVLIHNTSNKVVTIQKNSSIVIITVDGQKIRGELIAFDNLCISIQNNKKNISEIPIENIELFKKELLNNKKWLNPFQYTAKFAIMFIIATPFIRIFDGKKAAEDSLVLSGILAAVSSPAIIVSLSKRKFNLKKDWSIAVR